MKKILKQNKGFSLVELLIALLIMAVIAGTAITLFGGVLETSKGGADRETAESIRRAILTYMNASNDTDLSYLKNAAGTAISRTSNGTDLVEALAEKTTIAGATTGEVDGTYGPFLEKVVQPTQNGMKGWKITINYVDQIVSVKAVSDTAGGQITLTDS